MGVREILHRRLSWPEAVAYVGISVAFIFLLSGDLLLAATVLLAGVVGPDVYLVVQRRRRPARTERLSEAVLLPRSCETVWDLVKPAEKSPLIDPTLRRGYRVPGTPDGLGERQAFEQLDGVTVIVEVIEYRHERRAVTRQVSPPPVEPSRLIHTVDPVDGGCTYTVAAEIELRAGQRIRPEFERAWRSTIRAQLERTRQLLDASCGDSTETADARADPTPPSDGSAIS